MKRWRKLGKIFCAAGQSELMVTGGRAPACQNLGVNTYKIYFGSYDRLGRGRVFSLVIDINRPLDVEDLSTEPILELGETGYYDDNGIIPSCLFIHEGRVYLYTIGFSVKNKLIFDAASGLAVSDDGGNTFVKYKGPVIDRGVDDPCFSASPFVLHDEGLFKMWYVSCSRWSKEGERLKHYYNIRYRVSEDPVYWPPRSSEAVPFQNEHEYAIARPSVLKEGDGTYRMWYCFREQAGISTYRIGYAESQGGLSWVRNDSKCDLDVSADGWDSEMICYPYVFTHQGTRFMLYNGNNYGKSGFGIAVWEE